MPPPPAPHGPRSPAAGLAAAASLGTIGGARTSSPGTPKVDGQTHVYSHSLGGGSSGNGLINGSAAGHPRISTDDDDDIYSIKAPADGDDEEFEQPIKPSDKALGKRKVVDTDNLPACASL